MSLLRRRPIPLQNRRHCQTEDKALTKSTGPFAQLLDDVVNEGAHTTTHGVVRTIPGKPKVGEYCIQTLFGYQL